MTIFQNKMKYTGCRKPPKRISDGARSSNGLRSVQSDVQIAANSSVGSEDKREFHCAPG